MIRLLEALRSQRTDEGFTLVEAVVSMLVLAILTTGIFAGTGVATKVTADNRSRQIAVNLAEQQLDQDRGILDPTKIYSFGPGQTLPAKTQVVGSRTYTITQETSLVGVSGNDITCGSSDTINFRRISVSVTWSGMLTSSAPVTSDTIMAPNGRINDSSTGSIAVRVTDVAGTAESGVSVRIDPVSSTAVALQAQPAATDIEGCSYALGIYPGQYKVSITRSGGIGTAQTTTAVQTLSVAAGSTTPAIFDYDDAARFTVSYTPANAVLPTTMPITLLTATGNPYVTSSTAAAPTSVALFPYPAGYTAIAGAVADTNGNTLCAAQDPAAWPAGTYGPKKVAAGSRGNTVSAAPGGTAALTVPMGSFTVNPGSALTLTAVAQDVTTNGQPGCDSPQTFTFSTLSASTVRLALPYGTYKLYSGGGGLLGSLTNLVGSTLGLQPVTDPVNGLLTTFNPGTSTLTLDPRPAS